MKKLKKLLCVALTICIFAACTINITQAATVQNDLKDPADNQKDSDIQGNTILHCFDWSYKAITDNLDKIAEAGYTAVQTSPVQAPKDYSPNWLDTDGQWWKLYQPLDFKISNNTWLGTKAQLTALCTEAKKYNIKIVVDIVANHLANNGTSGGGYAKINSNIDPDLKNEIYFHTSTTGVNDNSRYNMTQYHLGMPDLNTGNSLVQQKALNLLKECIDCGVDGFRFDAAKHIELPTDDSSFASQFWPVVINGAKNYASEKGVDEPFFYGEILNSAGTNIENYTQYMDITDNTASNRSLTAAKNSNASNLSKNKYDLAKSADKAVLWVESHDTYMHNETSSISDATIIKAWAITGARADSTALFFARPNNAMGKASTNTNWYSKPISEINKFKKEFNGQSEKLSYSGKVAYIERGTTGVSISKLNGTGEVSLSAKAMQDGIYTDQITGNTFTVSEGVISGMVGDTGVAVVYNPSQPSIPKPTMTISKLGGSFNDTITITAQLTGSSTLGAYKIGSNSAVTFTDSTSFTIGSDMDYNDTVTIVYTATDGNLETKYSYEYRKVNPNYNPFTFPTERTVYLLDTAEWGNANCYAWIRNTNTSNVPWPGEPIEKVGEYNGYDVYSYEVPEQFNMVIFNDGANQTPDLAFREQCYYDNGNKKWVKVENPFLILGDTDLSGEVEINDVTQIQRSLVYLKTLTAKQTRVSDVDGDGELTIRDATFIQRYLAHFKTNYDIGKPISNS